MIWRMQVITLVVLWISMVSLRECITLEQYADNLRYDNKSSANKVKDNVLLQSASDEPLALNAHRKDSSHSRQTNGKSFAKLSIDARQNASFNTVYHKSVKRGELAIFNFLHLFAQDQAVRLHVSSSDADITMPVLFVVKEQHSILSWQVPLITYNKMVYHNVSRTLCNVNDASEQDDYVGITVEVSTVSSKPVDFTLQAELISFDLSVNNQGHMSLTASQPVFLRYTFVNESSVMVSVSSPDETCLLFSVQEIKCPVADSVTDLNHYHGMSQTVSRNGSITVERSHFAGDSFFVVLTVLPSDYNCKQIEVIKQPGMHGDDRKKSVYIEITPSGSGIWLAVTAAVAWFLAVYLLTFIITCVYRTCEKRQHRRASQRVEEERLCVDNGVDPTSGSISVVEPQVEDNVLATSSPPDSVVDSDTSIMGDIEEDKDVFRTKRFMYVCDLARKPPKVLMKKYKLYYWNLIPISIFYILPVVQLMFNYTELLKVTGDQDLCYFNFKCVNPVSHLYSFNNVFSNIGYVMLGLLFLLIVHQRDVRWQRLMQQNTQFNQYCGIPQQFGLFYAMGIALGMEGILSSCYHVCPNHSNFQFDTAFMYVMACLLMLCLYQKRHPDISPNAHTAYTAMSLVIFIQVIGVVYMPMNLLIVFTIVHLVCTLLLSIQIYYMGRWKLDLGIFGRVYQLLKVDRHRCAMPIYLDRICLLLIGITVNVSVDVYSLWKRPPFANYLLLVFMVNLTLYFAFYITMKLRSHEKIRWVPACYIILGTILWGLAFYFYLHHATSWHETPARSREFNSRCILFNFYDSHDIWHFLSSMSLFFSLMTLLTLDDDLLEVPRGSIYVF